jgi:5-methylcytosine-specific restriction endonuclease McrA
VGVRHSDRSYRRQRRGVLEAAGWRCQIRGPRCTGRATTVDHVVALAEGGTHERWNLRAACRACNSAGGAAITNRRRWAERALGRRSRQW